MNRRRGLVVAATTAAAAGVAIAVLRGRGRPRRAYPVLQGRPLLVAHRGGAGLAPENTLSAFLLAHDQWRADMIELDVHASADGRCVVIHDPTVERTTDGTGAVAGMAYAELAELDAGYRFTRDGIHYPFRGRGARIPTIEDVLEALPEMRFTIEVKDGRAQRPLFDAIARLHATHRVVAAGMYDRDRTLFGEFGGATSASTEALRTYVVAHRLRADRLIRTPFDVVQVPEYHEGSRVVTPRLIRSLHLRGVPVHVWTVNDPGDMQRLLEWGVDGLVTDRPDLAGRVMNRIYGRPLAPGHVAGPA